MRYDSLLVALAAVCMSSPFAATDVQAQVAAPERDCNCIADLDGDCMVDSNDLLGLITQWGASFSMDDLDLSGDVDVADLVIMIGQWGACSGAQSMQERIDLIALRAAQAYVWSLPLNWSYRFQRRSGLIYAEPNTLYYASLAAWNTGNYYAANASTIYLSSALSLEGEALVLTVPPTILDGVDGAAGVHGVFNSTQLYDVFLNSIADPGTRTTGNADQDMHFLIVGPGSQFEHEATVTIEGEAFPVIAVDTNQGVLLARVWAHTLAPAANPMSTPRIKQRILEKYALNTLEEFIDNDMEPIYYTPMTVTELDRLRARRFQQTPEPQQWRKFFRQVGQALEANDLPTRGMGLSGTDVADLPSYIIPDPAAAEHGDHYHAPSWGQRRTLRRFNVIGLSEDGYALPPDWGDEERAAMALGVEFAAAFLAEASASLPATEATNYWTYRNSGLGTYPNSHVGYLYRAIVVVLGGLASYCEDGVYAEQASASVQPDCPDADPRAPLDGSNYYTLTILPDDPPYEDCPVTGIQPPLQRHDDGDALGFWSLTVYQPDTSQSTSPFLSQAGVLNRHYSHATERVVVDPATNTFVAKAPVGISAIEDSTPIVFGPNATPWGLSHDHTYFVTGVQVVESDCAEPVYRFQVAEQWVQDLSETGTPIQDTGSAADIVSDLTAIDGVLRYGVVKPVSQLGSAEIERGDLQPNDDGSYTIWLGPTLMDGAFESNWIPTPSQQWLTDIYGDVTLSSDIRPYFRLYAPQPGDTMPSILPHPSGCDDGGSDAALQDATYRFPLLRCVDGP